VALADGNRVVGLCRSLFGDHAAACGMTDFAGVDYQREQGHILALAQTIVQDNGIMTCGS
jgi:hypothetical protein